MNAPKDLVKNASFRKKLIERAIGDPDFQKEVWIRCARDPLFYVDTFLFTYAPKGFPDAPNRPFVLYPYQETAFLKMAEALGRHPMLVEKSRDMGATWLVLALYLWRWHFYSGQSFLLGSRKQELVDKSGDPKSLFWKLDYMIGRLPPFLRPFNERTALHYLNVENGSVIDGESTNDDFARGDRRTSIMLDEFPAVENGYRILEAVGDATDSPIFAGTSQGASGAYYDILLKMREANPERIIRFHWTDHPLKRRGLYTSRKGKLEILDAGFVYPEGYKFILDDKVRSVAYDEREKRAANQQEMAQEWDIDYMLSGWQFFDPKNLESLKVECVRKPLVCGDIVGNPDWRRPEFYEADKAPLKLWFHPVGGKVPEGWNDCVIACDVSTGKGGEMTSNSVAVVARKTTGEQIAEFATNTMSPSDFCKYVLAMCKWFNDAYLIWEENGPGGEFTKQIKETDYRTVYYRNDSETKFGARKTRAPGWWSNKDTKRILLSDFGKAIIARRFIPRSDDIVTEAAQYVHLPNGVIEHSRSKVTPDPTASGENHGDRIIAAALAWHAIAERAIVKDEIKDLEPPPNSFGWRRLLRVRDKASKRLW